MSCNKAAISAKGRGTAFRKATADPGSSLPAPNKPKVSAEHEIFRLHLDLRNLALPFMTRLTKLHRIKQF